MMRYMGSYSPVLNFIYRTVLFIESVIGISTVGAQTIVLKDRSVLLIKPTYRPYWEFPGGKAEKGEAPETAAIRETKEEARIFVKKLDRKLGTYTDEQWNRKTTVHVFVAGIWEELDLWKPGVEIAERGFFSLDNLPQDISPATMLRIKELLSSPEKEFSSKWVY